MELRFNVLNSEHMVEIEQIDSERYSAKLNNKNIDLTCIPISENCFTIFIGNTLYKVFFSNANKRLLVSVGGDLFEIEDVTGLTRISQSVNLQKMASSDSNVRAPMPGRVLKILVSESQQVNLNQPLFIVESMKMENEVVSPIAGRVKRINSQVNDLISVGDTIIELEPGEDGNDKNNSSLKK